MSTVNIFWFRRDLRLDDNVGFLEALKGEHPVLPIFIFDKEILNELPEDDARVTFIFETLQKMRELNVSISKDRKKALEYPKKQVVQAALQWETFGFTPEEYDALHVKREWVLELKKRIEAGANMAEAASVVNEDMVRACYVAGPPEEAVEQIVQLSEIAADLGYDQIALAKLGPDYQEAITLLADQIMPALH